LFAGKFEEKKRPLQLMRAVRDFAGPDLVLVLAGGGELKEEVESLAALDSARFRVLPFQNQSRMPVIYRLGDIFVLPSAWGETWGLAVNEAMACGRPVLVSNRVGCAADVVTVGCGRVFPWADLRLMMQTANEMVSDPRMLSAMGREAARRAWLFDTVETEKSLVKCLNTVVRK
jgi:glycosyltransferase involved in cell wall biosynthesis